MSFSQALDAVKREQTRALQSEYAGKGSNQLIAELKGAALSQFDRAELLTVAPTALSFQALCWIAASQPEAEQMSLEKEMPASGAKYLTSRRSPSLRSCLVDACNAGGRAAFTIAGANIDALQIRGERLCQERTELVVRRLPQCNQNGDALEDFNDAVQDFVAESKQCAMLARETREAFAKWSLMVAELHAVVERQEGVSPTEGLTMVDIEQKFDALNADVKGTVARSKDGLKSAEKRLDQALTNVPSSWQSYLSGSVAGFNMAIPSIISATLPAILAGSASIPAAAADLADPAYSTAIGILDLVNHFYEYLGGEKGTIDRSKFDAAALTYISTTLSSTKAATSNSDSGRKLQDALDKIIAVASKMKEQADLPDTAVQQWKDGVKTGRDRILALVSTVAGFTSNAVPMAFVRLAPAQNTSAAAVHTIVQGVQVGQTAVETAQSNYDAAVARQVKTAAAMAAVNAKLAKVQADGEAVRSIRSILHDGLLVLIGLTNQMGKLERYCGMVAAVVNDILRERADTFSMSMGKGSQRTIADGAIKVDDVTKQTIYALMLHLKAYFSLLSDIAGMYASVDRQHLTQGNELCMKLSKGVASNEPMERLQEELGKYTQESARTIAELAKQSQDEVLNKLKDRASRAAETTETIENAAKGSGLVIDQSAKSAIGAGGEAARKIAQEIIAAKTSEVTLA